MSQSETAPPSPLAAKIGAALNEWEPGFYDEENNPEFRWHVCTVWDHVSTHHIMVEQAAWDPEELCFESAGYSMWYINAPAYGGAVFVKEWPFMEEPPEILAAGLVMSWRRMAAEPIAWG